jgi:tRNA (guanine-N7-)-methyltransferase
MKRKLARFAENETFPHLFQPKMFPPADHELKGKWHASFFKNENPIVLELGCGRGEYTVSLAEKFPDKNFIGIDWKGARLWRGAKTSFENKMTNVAFLRIQIQNILNFFSKNEVSEIWITFPDPQPQQSRQRKRLTAPRFMSMYRQILTGEGIIHLKTDNAPLHEYTLEVIEENKFRKIYSTRDLYHSDADNEILGIKTTYEKMFLQQGLKICYLKFSFTPANNSGTQSDGE